jgi:WD40 repeat protein
VSRLENDQRLRWGRGDRFLVENYVEEYPQLRADPVAIVDLIYNEFLLRTQGKESPSVEEYLARFPDLVGAIRDQFEVHGALAAPSLFGSVTQDEKTVDAAGAAGRLPAGPTSLPAVAGYQILKELGRGGMGVVYWAWQNGLNRTVALKMILAGSHAGPRALARFRTEAEAVGRVNHPNIVQIHEVGEHEGLPFLSMEYVDAGSLSQRLYGTPWPAQAAAELAATLAEAIHAAHRRGIVHRDLTPANILFTAEDVPKIMDFGLAKLLVGGGAAQTQTDSIVGTPSYMSPEQAAGGSKDINPAADVYALGSILYELVTGRPPFKAETPLETLWQVQSLDPVSPSRLQPKLPRDLSTICLKAMAKAPGQRYRSASDLAADLRRFLAGVPIQARPVGKAERLWRWCRRNPALAVVSGLAVVPCMAAVGLSVAIAITQSLAAGRLRDEQANTTAALEESKRLSSRLARERGLLFKEQKNVAAGMLWLAESLRLGPDDLEFQRPNRANLAGWSRELRPLRGVWAHPGAIHALAFSPDGKTAVLGDDTGTARIWDVASGKPIGPPLRHEGPIWAVALSPDGNVVVTGGWDHTARLWNAATGAPVGKPLQHTGRVWTARFSPNGKTVVTGSDDPTIYFWNAASGESLKTFPHRGSVMAAVFSADGQTVLTGSDDGNAQLWSVGTGAAIGKPLQHNGKVRAVAFSPDGETILTGSEDTFARMWKKATGALIKQLPHDATIVQSVAFSPDGQTVVTANADGAARLWNAATGEILGQPLEQKGEVCCVAFSPGGKFLLTGDESGAGRLWDVTMGNPRTVTLQHKHHVGAAVFSPDGQTILTGSGDPLFTNRGEAQLWDADTGRPLGPAIPHDIVVLSVAFRPDGKLFATGTGNPLRRDQKNKVQLWETVSRKPVGRPLEHGGPILSMAFSPDGRMLLTGGDDDTARLWDVAGGELITALKHPRRVCAVTFSPDGTKFVTGGPVGGLYGHAQLWDTATRQPVGEPLRHIGYVLAVAFSPDGQTLMTGCEDKTARQWQTGTGRQIGKPLRHQHYVRAVAYSPDGQTILTGCWDGTGQLWEAATGKPLDARWRHEHWVVAAAFRPPDGQWVLTGSTDRTVRLREVKSEPVAGTVERLSLWTQVITGMQLDADGQLHVLDAATWQQRRQELDGLGGPPVP